jgi:type III pantothenate kinase
MGAPNATVVATGGLAPIIAEQTDVFTDVNEELTLQGLRLIFDLNQEQPSASDHAGSAT